MTWCALNVQVAAPPRFLYLAVMVRVPLPVWVPFSLKVAPETVKLNPLAMLSVPVLVNAAMKLFGQLVDELEELL